MVLHSFSDRAACHSICIMHIVISSLFSSVALYVVSWLLFMTALVLQLQVHVSVTYYIHVVFVFVPLCFTVGMPCCEYCWSLPVTYKLLVVMLSPVGQ